LCVAALAVLVAACTGPKRGSIEWHKQEYRKARTRAAWQPHSTALIELGYLEQREFTVSNVLAAQVVKVLHDQTFEALSRFDFNDFAEFHAVTTNRVRVVGARFMVAQWEKEIRKLDVPQSGK
jgi:hypothetical protein